MRNFINLLEAPLQAQEQTEAISALAEEQGVFRGKIDPSLVGLKKAEVLKLIKEAGLSKGKAQEFQRKTVKQLKIIYTEHLQKTRSATEQARSEAFGFLSDLGEKRKQVAKERKKFQMDALMSRIAEYEEEMQAEQRESEEILKAQRKQDKAQSKQQQKQEREMMGEEEKQTRKAMREPKKDKGQQGIAKFMAKQSAKR